MEIYKEIAGLFVKHVYESIQDLSAALLVEAPLRFLSECADTEKLSAEMAARPQAADMTSCVDQEKLERFIQSRSEYVSFGGYIVEFRPDVLPLLPELLKNKEQAGDDVRKQVMKEPPSSVPEKQKIASIEDETGSEPSKDKKNKLTDDVITSPLKDAKTYETKRAYMAAVNREIAENDISAAALKKKLVASTRKEGTAIQKEMKNKGVRDTSSQFGIMWFIERQNPGITDTCIRSFGRGKNS